MTSPHRPVGHFVSAGTEIFYLKKKLKIIKGVRTIRSILQHLCFFIYLFCKKNVIKCKYILSKHKNTIVFGRQTSAKIRFLFFLHKMHVKKNQSPLEK